MLLSCHIYRRDAIHLNVCVHWIIAQTISLGSTNAECISSFESLERIVIFIENREKNEIITEGYSVIFILHLQASEKYFVTLRSVFEQDEYG